MKFDLKNAVVGALGMIMIILIMATIACAINGYVFKTIMFSVVLVVDVFALFGFIDCLDG